MDGCIVVVECKGSIEIIVKKTFRTHSPYSFQEFLAFECIQNIFF